MRKVLLAAAMLALPALALADGDSCLDPLPETLPLNGTVTASTCVENPNDICTSTPYESPIATSRFTLDAPASVGIVVSGVDNYDPAIYLTGRGCQGAGCPEELPAGSYCVTITAGPFAAVGSCGCFALRVETTPDDVFWSGFDD